MKVLAVIPARGNSTRLSNKNCRVLGDRTLVELAYDAAIESGICNRIVVSTNQEKIARGLDWIKRPEQYATAVSDISDAIHHALVVAEEEDGCQYDFVVTLQPTLPCRPSGLIKAMFEAINEQECDSALTVMPTVPWMWRLEGEKAYNAWTPNKYPRSQDVGYRLCQELNCVQIAKRATVLCKKRWELPLLFATLPSWAFIDIDDIDDLQEAEQLWSVWCRLMKQPWKPDFHKIVSINESKDT